MGQNSWLALAFGTIIMSAALLTVLPASASSRPWRVVALGDSVTAGYGLPSPELAYPARLSKLMADGGFAGGVVNAGVSGDTTSNGLQRVQWVLREPTDVLIIALGSNDALRGLPPEGVERNLEAIIQRARSISPGLKLILVGALAPPNMGELYASEFRKLFTVVAEREAISFVPFLLEGVAGVPALNQPDGIHPTAEGQQIIAAHLWKALEPLLREPATDVKK